MIQHTVILSTSQIIIPSVGIPLLVKHIIENYAPKIEYFRDEPDNPADYVDEEMQRKIDTTTFMEINFETEMPLDYDSYDINEVYTLILDHIQHSKTREVTCDNKDITMNLSNIN